MSNTATVFSRKFSRIGDLQEQKQINYYVTEDEVDGKVFYGIGISADGLDERETDHWAGLSSSKNDVLEVVTFLYENAVQLATWREVAGDLLERYTAGETNERRAG